MVQGDSSTRLSYSSSETIDPSTSHAAQGYTLNLIINMLLILPVIQEKPAALLCTEGSYLREHMMRARLVLLQRNFFVLGEQMISNHVSCLSVKTFLQNILDIFCFFEEKAETLKCCSQSVAELPLGVKNKKQKRKRKIRTR